MAKQFAKSYKKAATEVQVVEKALVEDAKSAEKVNQVLANGVEIEVAFQKTAAELKARVEDAKCAEKVAKAEEAGVVLSNKRSRDDDVEGSEQAVTNANKQVTVLLRMLNKLRKTLRQLHTKKLRY